MVDYVTLWLDGSHYVTLWLNGSQLGDTVVRWLTILLDGSQLCDTVAHNQGCSYSGRQRAVEPTTDVRSPALHWDRVSHFAFVNIKCSNTFPLKWVV